MTTQANQFELASRSKLRFETLRGHLSVEELWDLSLNELDTIAKRVNKTLKTTEEESFIPTAAKKKGPETELRLKLDILVRIIEVKVAEQDAAKARAERRAKLARLKELAADKADQELAGKSLDDINKMIEELSETGGDE